MLEARIKKNQFSTLGIDVFSVLDSELPRQLDLFPFSSRVHYKNRSSISRAGRVGVLFIPLCGIGNFATGRKGMVRVDDISGRLIERASSGDRQGFASSSTKQPKRSTAVSVG